VRVRESEVAVRAPYRLDLTAVVMRRLSTNVVDTFDGTTYRRLLGEPAAPTLLSVAQAAPTRLHVRLDGPAAEALEPDAVVRRMLGTDVALDAFDVAAARIGWLAPLAAAARGVKPPRYPSLWETVVNAVAYQQVSIHAAGAILRRVIERYAPPHDVDGVRLRAFVPAATILAAPPPELRNLGLSVNKVVSLHAVARAIEAGTLDEAALERLPTPGLLAALTAHRGIGPWTAAVIALRGFGRLDVFPMNDSGATAGLRHLSGDSALEAEPVVEALVPQPGMLYYHLLLGRLVQRGEVVL
jgi:DNA-3-methyladenine glycosylase II